MLHRVSQATPVVSTEVVEPKSSPARVTTTREAPIASGQKSVTHAFDAVFWRFLARCSKTGPTTASSLKSLRDNQVSADETIRMIDEAKHSLTFSYYGIGPDAVGHRFVDALIAAAKRGVRVVGGLNWAVQKAAARFVLGTAAEAEKIAKKLDALVAAGGHITYTGLPEEFLDRAGYGNHFKFLCKDSDELALDGRNKFDLHFADSMRDIGFLMTGPVAAAVERQALEMFSRARAVRTLPGTKDVFPEQRKTSDDIATIELRNEALSKAEQEPGTDEDTFIPIVWDPLRDAGSVEPMANPIELAVVRTIELARDTIYIAGNYISDEGAISQALMEAAQRGVDVNVVTRGFREGEKIPYIFTSKNYPLLVAAGIKLWETQDISEHGKALVVDKAVVAWGSFNPEIPAIKSLVEGMVFTGNKDVVREIEANIKETIADSRLVTPLDAHRISRRRWTTTEVILSHLLRRWI